MHAEHGELLAAVWEWATHRRGPECQSTDESPCGEKKERTTMNSQAGSAAEALGSFLEALGSFLEALGSFLVLEEAIDGLADRENAALVQTKHS
ncbi:uncharacterized protein V6R79_011751 [Siganus canaliculatus]